MLDTDVRLYVWSASLTGVQYIRMDCMRCGEWLCQYLVTSPTELIAETYEHKCPAICDAKWGDNYECRRDRGHHGPCGFVTPRNIIGG